MPPNFIIGQNWGGLIMHPNSHSPPPQSCTLPPQFSLSTPPILSYSPNSVLYPNPVLYPQFGLIGGVIKPPNPVLYPQFGHKTGLGGCRPPQFCNWTELGGCRVHMPPNFIIGQNWGGLHTPIICTPPISQSDTIGGVGGRQNWGGVDCT